MTIDWTLNLGNMITIAVLMFGVAGFYFRNETMREDVVDIKKDLKTLNATVTEVALQKQRQDASDARQNELARRMGAFEERITADLKEIRRGEGLIVERRG